MGFFRVVARTCPPALPADLVVVPSGVFQMGQVGVAEPVHEVTLSRDYALGACEVTNAQFIQAAQWALDHGQLSYSNQRLYCHGQLVMELVGSLVEVTWNSGTLGLRRAPLAWLWGYADAYTYDPSVHPVKLITWYGAACYCDWRSQMEGLAPYYEGAWAEIPGARNPYGAEGYRLPTEAEWEHAARWQDGRSYPWGQTMPDCAQANFNNGAYCVGWSSPVGTHPAGASSLGLQDLAGNAWEWCNDWYAAYTADGQVDPVGQAGGDYRVGRGGGWGLGWTYLRAAHRHYGTPTDVATNIGFRVCRTVPR
jgi:formylglycine-generating enzyme required for sulfatase activity